MSFSSDQPQLTNQLPVTINLPDIKNTTLFQERITTILRDVTNSVNSKEGGLYSLQESSAFNQYYIDGNPNQFRSVYRKVLDFVDLNGANIGASASVNFVHNITGVQESAFIYANCTATDGRRFSVVFPDVWIDSTDAYFTNPIAVQLSQCDIVINCLKVA